MATTIITKNGSGAPLAGDLTAGELAVDLTNKRLYSKDSGGNVIELGTNAGSSTFADLTVSGDLTVDTDTLYVDSADNRVGVGLTNPEARLHVDGTGGGIIRLSDLSASSDGDQIGGIAAAAGAGTFYSGINFFYHDSNDGEIRFRTKVNGTNTDVMTIVDGNVGIGEDAPSVKLHVNGGGSNTLALFESTDAGAAISFKDGNTTTNPEVDCRTNDLVFNTDNAERVRITSDGTQITNNATIDSTWADNAGLSVKGSFGGGVAWLDGASGGFLAYVTNAGNIWHLGQANASSAPTEVFQVNQLGNFKVSIGNIVIGTNGKGIDFSANSNSSGMTSELLDDYEEGSFTADIRDGTSSVSIGTGYYTKVGNMVTCTIIGYDQNISSLNTSHLRLGGLPFNASTDGAALGRVSCTNFETVFVQVVNAQNYGFMYGKLSSGPNVTSLVKTDFASTTGASIWITISYRAA